MYWLRKGSQLTSVAILLAMACGVGCSTLPSSGIDPSGESVFLGPPPSNPFSCSDGTTGSTTYAAPSTAGVLVPNTSLQQNRNSQLGKTSGPKLLPKPLLGESYDNYPTQRLQWDNTGIILRPGRIVAPVGSQVIVAAGVVAPDHYLSMNERVEWSLTSSSVGQFVEVEPDTWTDWFLMDFTLPRKIGPYRAVTSTSRNNMNITQGSPVANDDMKVQRGETWVAVTSPVEGTSFVTAFAPSVYSWNARARTAMIHWVDAKWQFPAPSFAPAGGRQVLKTMLSRQSDNRPLAGWRVRYTVTGGPAAGFTPDGSKVTEVVTNQNGEAIVEIAEQQAASGTNQVCIEIVRPDGIGNGGMCGVEGSAITVGNGSTMVTWSAPELALTKTGPPAVGIGSALTYQINVTNPGDLPTDDVQITDEIPAGAEYIDSNPPAQPVGSSLQWQIGRLNPRETRIVQVRLRAAQSGSLSSCAEATAVGGLAARGCITTSVGSPKLEIKLEGPPAARVGDVVQFDIYVINRSQVPATNLTIVDQFDEGLVSDIPNAMQNRQISKQLNDIQPGRPSHIKVSFRTTKTGRLCHKVIVTDSSGNQTTANGCVDVSPVVPVDTGASTDTLPPALPSGGGDTTPLARPDGYRSEVQPPLSGRPEVQIEKTGPAQATVGENVVFMIVVKNVGQAELTNVKVVDSYDPQLKPVNLTADYTVSKDKRSVSWMLASLLPGKSIPYQIECQANRPVGLAYNRASVTTDQDVEDTSEARIEIVEPAATGATGGSMTGPDFGNTGSLSTQPPSGLMRPGNLVLKINDDRDPVASGKYFNYNISVTNQGAYPDQNVTLVLDVSSNLTPLLGATGPDGMTQPSIKGQQVAFAPVQQIKPGETLWYNIRVKTGSPGFAETRATVSSQGVPKLEAIEETKINPAQ